MPCLGSFTHLTVSLDHPRANTLIVLVQAGSCRNMPYNPHVQYTTAELPELRETSRRSQSPFVPGDTTGDVRFLRKRDRMMAGPRGELLLLYLCRSRCASVPQVGCQAAFKPFSTALAESGSMTGFRCVYSWKHCSMYSREYVRYTALL